MVTYDLWSYMTITLRIFDVVWGILREGIRIDGGIMWAKLQKVKNAGPEGQDSLRQSAC